MSKQRLNIRKSAVFVLATAGAAISVLIVSLLWTDARYETDAEILDAIRRGSVTKIESYLARGGSPDRYIDVYGRRMSMLRAAVTDREGDVALMLVQAGADLEVSDVTIQEVGRNGLRDLLNTILMSQPTAQDGPRAYTGIMDAAANGFYDVVEVYLSYAAESREEWALELNRAAGVALSAGYDDVARLLFEGGAPLDQMLHAAARFSSGGMVRYLVARGADPDAALPLPENAVPPERRPIEFAIKRHMEGSNLYENMPDNMLASASGAGDAAYVIYELARAGADVDHTAWTEIARDGVAELEGVPAGRLRLLRAAEIGFYDIAVDNVSSLLSSSDLRDALLLALATDHDDIARQLISEGATVSGGPLHVAAAVSSPGMVRTLLSAGADPNGLYESMTPLQYWLEHSVTEDPELILHELIVAGADACWLINRARDLPGASATILQHSAPHCWD